MEVDPIPADIQNFILRHVDSVAQLEALLLLRGNTHETWTPAITAKRLYANEQEITEVLDRLCEDGLLKVNDGVYRYDADPELRGLIDRLVEVYSRHLIAVTNMIHAKPRRIRQFADAFKIRKDR
jgi:hypothetical protein